MRIKNTVKELINTFVTRDPFELIDFLNIELFYCELGKLHGMYRYYEGHKQIFINQALERNEQRVTCAHELGHALLHSDLCITFLSSFTFISEDKLEREANKFAAELLLDDSIHLMYPGLTMEQIALAEEIHPYFVGLKYNI